MTASHVTVVIPTLGREAVLLETIRLVLALDPPSADVLVVDQTPVHETETERQLREWDGSRRLRWLRLDRPSVVHAMNVGLREARTPLVLFLDDDIVPAPALAAAHAASYERSPDVWAVAGQVLQADESPVDKVFEGARQGLYGFKGFPFNSSHSQWVGNVMAGNLSVRRERALEIDGFDENFIPPVAYRFETEFARRAIRGGGNIWFEASASIRHLRAPSGGTRSIGSHLTSASPLHGVGDYYYALRCGQGWERFWYMLRRPFREVRTRYHLRHPWWIPVKFVGELRALLLAIRLYRRGQRWVSLLSSDKGNG